MFSASTHNPFRLRKTIAANRTMDPDDILNTKSALGQLGHLDVNRNGLDDIATRPMPTRTIINGVKSFQRKQGLKVDGLMKPDGPTARRITSLIGDPTVGDGPDERAAPRKPKSASTAAAPWFESRHLKQVSNEAASSNGRMLGGLLNYNVNGDLPNLFASALRTGLSEGDGAQPVREFADFLRQLGAKKPDRVPGFEGEVLSKLTGADRDRIKRLADGPPPRPVNAYAHRPDDDDLRNSLRTMEHRNDMVWENGKWRARTPADRAPGDLRLLSEDGGGDAGGGESGEAGGNNRDENANPDRQPQLAAAGETGAGPAPNEPAPDNPPSAGQIPKIPRYKTTDKNGAVKWETRVLAPDWKNFNDSMDRMKIPEFERKMYRDIFSHEGGSEADGTTKSGITQKIVNDMRNEQFYGKAKELDAIGVTAGKESVDLTMKQRIGVYRIYQDRIYGAAAKANGFKTGAGLLNAMGDPKVVGAVADTTFREGIGGGTVDVQEAINDYYQKAGSKKSVNVDGTFGSNTFKAVRDIVKSPQDRDQFLNLLADRRVVSRVKKLKQGQTKPPKGEITRIDFYRPKKAP